MDEFPRIKYNIGVDERGVPTKIYHLPTDLSYDVAKIVKPGEFLLKQLRKSKTQDLEDHINGTEGMNSIII